MRAQRLVIANIELALLGKPPIEEPPRQSELVRLPATPGDIQLERRDYERAQEWYDAVCRRPSQWRPTSDRLEAVWLP